MNIMHNKTEKIYYAITWRDYVTQRSIQVSANQPA